MKTAGQNRLAVFIFNNNRLFLCVGTEFAKSINMINY